MANVDTDSAGFEALLEQTRPLRLFRSQTLPSPRPLAPPIIRIKSEPVRGGDGTGLLSYAPRVRASFVRDGEAASNRRRLSIVIERKQLRGGARVRSEISVDCRALLRGLVALLLLSTARAYVVSAAPHRPSAAAAASAPAVPRSALRSGGWVHDSSRAAAAAGGGGGGGGGGWAISPLLFVPPVRARARLVSGCASAAPRLTPPGSHSGCASARCRSSSTCSTSSATSRT